jgi:hypothetical protein
MTTTEEDKIKELEVANEALRQANGRLARDLMDVARAIGAEPSFDAVCQRVADLMNLERRVRLLEQAEPE